MLLQGFRRIPWTGTPSFATLRAAMDEVTAKSKFSCPACGAEAVWTPAKHALVCPYCGTESPAELASDGSGIVEHDLVTALRSLGPASRGWQSQRRSVKCQSCHAISVFEPSRAAQRCDFCGSAQLIPVEETLAPIRPESLVPFKIDAPAVRDRIRAWYGSRWFAPNRLKRAALTDTLHGVYIPYWTFDARVHARWTAMAGHYYYVNETGRDSSGRTVTRRVRKTRWVPAAGELEHFFDDELVAASVGIAPKFLRAIEPFPKKDLVPYDAGYLAGWVVEQYQIDLIAAAQQARERMEAAMRSLCAREVPGDTYRDLRVEAVFDAQTFKHTLFPVWLVTYTFGSRTYHVAVNGATGSIAGDYPLSWVKITLAVLAALLVVWFVLAQSG